MQNLLEKYQSCPTIWRGWNKINLPLNHLPATPDSIREINNLVAKMRELNYNHLELTDSGGICTVYQRLPAYSLKQSKAGYELIIVNEYSYKIQCKRSLPTNESDETMTGSHAFRIFLKRCKNHGISIMNYAVDKETGKKINEMIPKPLISLANQYIPIGIDNVYSDCHHIDFHSSYPAGLVNTHPEFAPVVNELYYQRKRNKNFKHVLNFAIGFMHSYHAAWRYAQLAYDAISDNNARILKLSADLKRAGRIPILYNTDGIWYTGKLYDGPGEGNKLGEWHHDYVNCRLRIKSPGAYEFHGIDTSNNQYVYHPVVRGTTTLDAVKPRDKWVWGDIFNYGEILVYSLDEETDEIKIEKVGEI